MFRRCVGNSGYLEWSGNWISFIDTMLQFSIVGLKTKELYLPTRIRKVIIDPAKHLEAAKSDNSCKVYYDLSDASKTISSIRTFRCVVLLLFKFVYSRSCVRVQRFGCHKIRRYRVMRHENKFSSEKTTISSCTKIRKIHICSVH